MKSKIKNQKSKILIYYITFFISVLLVSNVFAASIPFQVLDISARTYDGGPAIAVLLSKPLDSTVRHESFLRISDSQQLLKNAWILSEDHRVLYFPHVEPETFYSVTVLDDLTCSTGEKLGKRVSKTLATRKITPVISFAGEGLLLPAKMTEGVPVVTVNVREVEIEFFKLNENALVHFVDWQNATGRKGYYQLAEIKDEKYGEFVFSGRFDLDAPPNKRVIRHIPVEDIPALQKPGMYLAVMREPGEYAYNYHATYFMVTDIGLHARVYKKESVIFASSLKTGKPLADVNLTFYNRKGKIISEGETDKAGYYKYASEVSSKTRIIQAKYENHISVLPLSVPALDMSEFDLGKRPYRHHEIFAYSPRDLYRPGETVTVSALLRDDDGNMIKTLPLTAKLYGPDGREVRSFTWHTHRPKAGALEQDEPASGFNYYQTTLNLPGDAQTGLWNLKIWDDPSAKSPACIFEFHVEEFLPERMKLELTSEEKYPGMDTELKIQVNGEYLYGAPAAGNNMSAKVRVKAKREIFDSLKEFQFGDVNDETYKDYWELSEQTLDNQGHGVLTVPNQWKGIKSPLSVLVVASLYEAGGRPVVRGIDQTIFPADTLIGIRPLFKLKSANEGPLGFEVVKVKSDGTLMPAQNLMIDVTKEDRNYYWEYSEESGWQHRYTEKKYQFLNDSLNLGADKPAPYTLHLERGQYVFAIKDPETNLITSLRFRVGTWWYGDDGDTGARPDKVVLKTDKPAYSPGDVIQLTVTPPHEGDAVITVEGESMLWFGRTPVSPAGTLVEIPVSAAWTTHNLYISAVVFRPANAKEKITPNRAVGLIHLPLERSPRKLGITIEAPEKAASQGPMQVRLKLASPDKSESSGLTAMLDQIKDTLTPSQEVFVTLAAVDVGILNITDFKTPDPFKWFFEPRRFEVNGYDIYGKVIENLDGKPAALRFGGDADLTAGKRPETKVRLLSLFQSPVAFDENGEAQVTFQLPDFNGRLRLMAIAFDKERFGSAETDVTVAAPVVTQLATPRFLAPGDQTEFTLDVHNLSGDAQKIDLALTVTPPLSFPRSQAGAWEREEKTLELADQEKTTLRFPVKANENYGASTIQLNLTGNNIILSREWQLGVRPGYPAIARKVRKILNAPGADSEKSKGWFELDRTLADDLILAATDVSLKISPVIPLDMRNAMKGLIGYPYGCLEQTTSQAYPLLFATPERISRYNLPVISHEERIRRMDKAVERLSTMQLASGGFGLWNKNSPEAVWLTVYVSDFLLQARDTGVNIPEKMLDNALDRIESYLQRSAPLEHYIQYDDRAHLDFAIRSYAGYVLSRVNRASLGTLRTLYDNHHKKAGSGLPLAHIGIALKKTGDTTRSQAALTLAAEKRCEPYGYWGDYSTRIRDLALTISLLIENKSADIKGFDKLMMDLEEALRHRRWLSTQEKYAIFKAGMALERISQKAWKGRLTIAGKELVLDRKGAYVTSAKPADVAKGISFAAETPGLLYVSVIVSGYTRTLPPKDVSHLTIERNLYDSKGKPVERNEFKVGELLVAHLRITSSQWLPDALVADFLPAGFELENQNLKHSVKLDDFEIEGNSVWRLRKQTRMVHEEYRDDRYMAVLELNKHYATHLFYLIRVVSPGTFSVPPPFAESMYRPEIRGFGDTPAPITILNKIN